MSDEYLVTAIGHVESPLRDVADAPRQPDEGAPRAVLVVDPGLEPAVADLGAGDHILVLTWLHVAERDQLRSRPRDDPRRPVVGVFSTRSPHRPNPIGVHRTTVVSTEGTRVTVDGLDAIDGTPVLDIKPVLGPSDQR